MKRMSLAEFAKLAPAEALDRAGVKAPPGPRVVGGRPEAPRRRRRPAVDHRAGVPRRPPRDRRP